MSIMDPLVVEEALTAVLERDWEGGIDNGGLDISQLESYINNDDNSDATLYFGDLQGVGDIKGLGNVTPRDSTSRLLHHHNPHHHSNLHQHSSTQHHPHHPHQPFSADMVSSGSSASSSSDSSMMYNASGAVSAYNFKLNGGGVTGVGVHGVGEPLPISSARQCSSSHYNAYGHHLPDSPPDSGSEPPYSPPDHPNLSPPQKGGVTELYPTPPGGGNPGNMMAFSYPVMQGQQQPLQQQQQHPASQPHVPVHNPAHNQAYTTLQNPHNPNNMAYQQPVILGGGNLVGPGGLNPSTPSAYGAPAGNPVPIMGGTVQPTASPVGGVGGGGGSSGGGGGGGSCPMPVGKKRKINDSSGGLASVVYIKEEPVKDELGDHGIHHHVAGTSSVTTYCEEDEYTMDSNGGPYMDSSYQCIKFHNFLPQNWSVICDAGLKEINLQTFRVDADKGFNFSNPDDAFVCQKKNHFQVTVHVQTSMEPIFVKTPEGLQKIDRFFVHFFGAKTESPSQSIRVEQSQSDRTKKAFHPVPVEMKPEQMGKITVGRLHFSETTSNNMRKKGKPNPDQRYFYLVVSLKAHCGDNSYTVAAQASEKIIVRASNPGQFESDVEYTFQRGTYPESIFHMGRVGVNTDRPDEAMVINGNLKITGQFLQPSDKRAKKDVAEVDTREQLKNVSNLRVVTYAYKEEFAETAGLKGDNRFDTGVIAQEVKEVIPDAVKTTGDLTLNNGDKINDFLLVNKDRIFMENVGAVKELCKVTGNLENRIGELEKMNMKIAQLKRMESFKSTTSSVSTRTSGTTAGTSRMSSVSRKGRGCTGGRRHKQFGGSPDEGICNNKTLQLTTITLVCIMAFCLMAMATIYILDYQTRNDSTTAMTTMTSITATTTTIVLSSSMATSTSNLPTTTTSVSTTDDNTLTSLVFTTTPSYGTTPTHGTTTRAPMPRPPPVGVPENCQETTTGDEPICDVFCCSVEEDTFMERVSSVYASPTLAATSIINNRRIVYLGHTTVPPTMSRYSEVFTNKLSTSDPNTVNDSTSQPVTKPVPSKKSISHDQHVRLAHLNRPRSRPSNSRSIKQTLSKRSIQSKRSTGSSPPHYKPRPSFGSTIPQIDIPNFNFTINHLYCLSASDGCLNGSASNYTYQLPISRFMPETNLTVRFKYWNEGSYRQPFFCGNCSHCVPSYPSIRCESPSEYPSPNDVVDVGQSPPDHDFLLHGVGTWSLTAYKFRIPVDNAGGDQNPCDLGADALGSAYYEINLIFKRICDK